MLKHEAWVLQKTFGTRTRFFLGTGTQHAGFTWVHACTPNGLFPSVSIPQRYQYIPNLYSTLLVIAIPTILR